jgi:hypothetical protein
MPRRREIARAILEVFGDQSPRAGYVPASIVVPLSERVTLYRYVGPKGELRDYGKRVLGLA